MGMVNVVQKGRRQVVTDTFGRPFMEVPVAERRRCITGHHLRHIIEGIVRGITAKTIVHHYGGSGAATGEDSTGEHFMLLPRLPQNWLFTIREQYIIIGYAVHEICHQLYTDFRILDAIFPGREDEGFKPTKQQKHLKAFWNAIEDYRIEKICRAVHPGFPNYIDVTRDRSALKFLERVENGEYTAKNLSNPFFLGAVAVTWQGAALNGYRTQAPALALGAINPKLRDWVLSWSQDLGKVAVVDDSLNLARLMVDDLYAQMEDQAAPQDEADPIPQEDESPETEENAKAPDDAAQDDAEQDEAQAGDQPDTDSAEDAPGTTGSGETPGSPEDGDVADDEAADGDESDEDRENDAAESNQQDSGASDTEAGDDVEDGDAATSTGEDSSDDSSADDTEVGGKEAGDAQDKGSDAADGSEAQSEDDEPAGEQDGSEDPKSDPDDDTEGQDGSDGEAAEGDGSGDAASDGDGDQQPGEASSDEQAGAGMNEEGDGAEQGADSQPGEADTGTGPEEDQVGRDGDSPDDAMDDDAEQHGVSDASDASDEKDGSSPSSSDSAKASDAAGHADEQGGDGEKTDDEKDASTAQTSQIEAEGLDPAGSEETQSAEESQEQGEGGQQGSDQGDSGSPAAQSAGTPDGEDSQTENGEAADASSSSAGSGAGDGTFEPEEPEDLTDRALDFDDSDDADQPSKPRPSLDVEEDDDEDEPEASDLDIDDIRGMLEQVEDPEAEDVGNVAPEDVGQSEGPEEETEQERQTRRDEVSRDGASRYAAIRATLGGPALRSAGIVRRLLQSRSTTRIARGREEGDLDFERVVGMALGHSSIYRQMTRKIQVNTAISLLLDNSGSMHGDPLVVCQKTAIVLDQSITGTKTALEITGFTSEWMTGKVRLYQYRTFEQKGVAAAASLGNMVKIQTGGTPVAVPIYDALRRLTPRPEERKIMIVVSDGDAEDPVEAADARAIAESMGCVVVGISIGTARHLAAMRQWCRIAHGIATIEELPQALAQIVQEMLS